jgi:VanZ family protein
LNTSNRRIIKVWLPSVIWLAIITLESTNIGSSEHTARFLYPIFAFLFGLDPARFAIWHALMRKAGHFVGYFILSVLLFRSWRATFPRLSTRWCLQWAAVAFLSTALVASFDEWHQSFLPSRTGTFRDVVLDSSAAVVAQIVLFITVKARSRTTAH